MKVLYLIETLGLGGAEKALYTTLNAMRGQKEFKSIVCCLFKGGPIASNLEEIGIPVFNIGLNSPYDWRRGIFKLGRIIKENNVDIIHTHLFYANIYGRIAAWLSGTKAVITTLHNPDYSYEDNGRFSYKIRKLIDRYSGRMINRRFIAVSHAVKKDYQKHMGFKNIDVVYNNIDPVSFKIDPRLDIKAEREALGLCRDDFVLLNIGRLHPQKGQIYLLEAMEVLVKRDTRFKLLIVGTGSLKDMFSSEIKKRGLSNNVFLLSERQDVIKLLQLSDVFAFPSIYEAFGVVVIEAMSMEKIVVVSNIDGLREVVGDEAGIYINSGDSKGIAEVILSISRDPSAYDVMKKRARRRVLDLFNSEENVGKLEKVYLECVKT